MKQSIRLTESQLHNIIRESVNRVLKEVSLKGKSGEEYSLHGDNFDSWATLAKLRKHQLNTPNRIMTGREEDAYKRDDDNSTDLMIDYVLMNNKRGRAVDRLMDTADETSDYISKDIINNYDPKVESKQHNGNKHTVRLSESDLHRIVKESVNEILNEIGDTPRGNFALNAVRGRRAAKRYRTNMGANAEAENNKVMGMASDTAWKNYQENPKLGYDNEAGYRYGFDKGLDKYSKA